MADFLITSFLSKRKTTSSFGRFSRNLFQGKLLELAFSDVIIKDKLFYLIIFKIFRHALQLDGNLRQNRVHKIHYIYYGAIETIVDDSPLFVHTKIPVHILDRLFLFSYKVPLGASQKGIKTRSQQCGKSNPE